MTVGVSRSEHLRKIEEAAEKVLSEKEEPKNIIIPVYKQLSERMVNKILIT